MLHKRLAAAMVLPLVAACAPVAQAQAYDISPRQLAFVDRTCRDVLGLKQGETNFAGCQHSLSDTLTTSLATSLATSGEGQDMAADTAVRAGLSFYEVPPLVRWERERLACSRTGLKPGSSPFGACVTSLEGAFLPRPN